METTVVERVIQSAPYPVEELRPIHSALRVASDYLAMRIASANRPDSPEDLQMRRSGASVQQIVTSFILEHYEATRDTEETIKRNWIYDRLAVFWQGYRELVVEPLKNHGIDINRLSSKVGMEQVFELKNGVKGMVATAVLAQSRGWEVDFPTIEEDVRQGIDLYLSRGSRRVPTQIKCKLGKKFGVVREGISRVVNVYIPADPYFFMDAELGIPHRKHAEDFDNWLTDHSRGI